MRNNLYLTFSRNRYVLTLTLITTLTLFGFEKSIAQCVNPPTASAGSNSTICSSSNYTLGGSIGGTATTAQWTSNGTGTFSPNDVFGTATTYTPSATDISNGSVTLTLTTDDPDGAGDCVPAVSSVVITISTPSAVITPNGPLTFCSGGSVTLTANASSSYIWSPGNQTTQSIVVTSSGIYAVTTTNGAGCSTSTSVSVTVNPSPAAPTITPSGPTTFCSGGSVDLSSSSATGNTWSTTATTQTITVNTSGNYTVTFTDNNGCSATSAPVSVTVNTPVATITPSGPVSFCDPGSVTLNVAAASSYLWAPNGQTTQSITVSTTGTYSVTVTDGNGCTASSSVNVAANAYPTASVSGNTVLCTGTSNLLTSSATAGSGTIASYQWILNGSTNLGTAATQSASTTGSYTVRVTNSNGCSVTSAPLVLTGSGPLSGTYTIGAGPASCTNYVSFAAAVTDLNTKGVSGNVIFQIAGGYTETVPAGGLILKQCALSAGLKSGPTRTVTFVKVGGGANPKLTAFTPGTSTTLDGIVKIVGMDNVTFDGIDLSENASNTTATTLMEMGYGIYKCDGNDGAVGVTITNCTITLSKVNTAAIGIRVANTTETGTAVTYTGSATDFTALWASRNRVTILANTITNVYGGVLMTANASTGNTNDSANVIMNNTINNFGGLATAVTLISLTDNRYFSISGNNINGGASTTGAITIINGGSGPYGSITGNTITVASTTNLTGAFIGITYGASGVNNNAVITGNSIQNCSFPAATTAAFTGITSALAGASAIISISNNTVTGNTITGTGTFTGITFSTALAPGTMNMNSNAITNNTKTGTGTFTGMSSTGSSATMTLNMNNNNISNNTLTGGAATCTFNGMTTSSAVITQNANTISTNSILNMSGTSAGTITGISNTGTLTVSENVTNNIIRKLFVSGVASSTGAHAIRGFNGSTVASDTRIVSNNTIDSLYTNAASSATITGILTITGGTVGIVANKIFDFYSGQSSATAVVKGISVQGGTAVGVINNMIGMDISAGPAVLTGTNAIVGVEVTAGSGVGIYYNTIRLAGTGSGTAFGSSGISLTSTTPNVEIRNNIVNNLTNAGGLAAANSAVALRRSAVAVTGYSSVSNNNIYYAGTPSSSHLIYYDGTNSYQTLLQLQGGAGINPRETSSRTELVTFQSTVGASANFQKVSTSVATNVEGGATPITSPVSVTTDYFNTTRNSFSPDIGAHEDNFINLNMVVTSLAATPPNGQCSAVNHQVAAVIVPGSNPISSVLLYYSFNGTPGPGSPVSMTNTSGNNWTGAIPAATPTNATVTWYVLATDGSASSLVNGTSYTDNYLLSVGATATANPNPVCFGANTTLNGSFTALGNATVGTGAVTNTTTTFPTPYGQFYGSMQEQYLITAAELQAAGLSAGNITGLAFFQTQGYAFAALQNFRIQIAPTNLTALTAAGVMTGYTSVYGPVTYTPPNVAGLAPITFTTPFVWNGVSNIVVNVWFSNCSVCNGTATCTTAFTDNGVVSQTITSNISTIDWHGDGNCTINSFAPSLTATTYTQRPNIQFTGNVAPVFASYSWSDGTNIVGTTQSVSVAPPAGSTTYTVTASDANGCTLSSAVNVTTITPPVAPNATNSTQCGIATPGVSVSGTGGLFKWYLSPSGGTALSGQANPTLSNYPISGTTTFYVSEFDGTCESPRTPVVATVNNPDAITAISSGTNICPFTNVNLSVNQTGNTNTYTYSWTASPASGSGIPTSMAGSPITIQGTTGGTFVYTVTATDAGASCVTQSTVSVTFNTPPNLPVPTATPSTYCNGGSSQLAANAFITGNGTLATTNPVTNNSSSAVGFDIVNTSTIPITLHYFSVGTTLAAGGTSAESVYYLPGGMNCVIPTNVTTAPGWVLLGSATMTSAGLGSAGIRSVIPFDVNITLAPGARAGFALGGASVGYITGTSGCPVAGSDANLTVYEGFGGTLTGTIAGRRWTGDVTYSYQVGNPNWIYSWTPTTDLATPNAMNTTANPTTTTTYTVQVNDAVTGCSNFGSVTVNVIAIPPAPAATNSTQCGTAIPAASVTGTGSTFKWYLVSTGGTPLPGESGSQLTSYSINTTTTFYVSEISGQCEGVRAMVIASVTNPDAVTATVSAPTCLGNSITLTANQSGPNGNVYAYNWNANPVAGSGLPSALTGSSITITPTTTGTYIYTVTATDGPCTAVSTISVTVGTPPSITNVSASSTNVCAGTNVTLTGVTGTSSSFNATIGTPNTSTQIGMPMRAGNGTAMKNQYLYTAAELTAAGLTAGSWSSITYNYTTITGGTIPNVTINIGHTNLTALSTTFEPTPATLVYGPTTVNPPTVLGLFTFTFTTPFVWNGTSNVLIQFCHDNPTVTAGSGQVDANTTAFNSVNWAGGICSTTTGTLQAIRPVARIAGQSSTVGPGTYSWQWSPGVIAPGNVATVSPATSTIYTVTASTGANGCTSSATVSVNVITPPGAPSATSSTQCGIGIPTASVTGSGGLFQWYTTPSGGTPISGESGSQLSAYSISSTTTFYVSEFDGTCEGPRTAVIANVTQPDPVTASASSPTCLGTSLTLTATQTGNTNNYSYTWTASPSANSGIPTSVSGSPAVVVPTGGGSFIYSVTAVDAVAGCTIVSTVSTTITDAPPITSASASPNPVCSGQPTTLTALTGSTANILATVGTGSITNATTAYPAPYGNWYWGARNQFLITAGELTAAGLTSGNITSLAYFVVSNGGNATYTNIDIDIKMTNATQVTTTLDVTGLTNVFTGSYTITPNAWNVHPFSTPFFWNGTSNILVNMCSYVSSGFTQNAIITSTATSYPSSVWAATDGSNIACTYTTSTSGTVSGVINQRPNMQFAGITSTVGPGSFNWAWNPGNLSGNVVTVTPSGNTTYIVTATNTASGCTSTQSVNVSVNPVPPAPVATNSTQCGIGIPMASVAGTGGSFKWYLAPSGGTALAGESGTQLSAYSISSTTTFYVAEFDGLCEGVRTAVVASVTQPDPVSITPSSVSGCANSSFTLTAVKSGSTNTYNYSWSVSPTSGGGISGPLSGSPVTITPTAGGTFVYSVTATDAVAGCITGATVSITITAPPTTPNPTAIPPSVCPGTTSQLNAGTFISGNGSISSPQVSNNSSSAVFFNVDNVSSQPITVNQFYLQTAGTVCTLYYQPSPLASCTTVPNIATFTQIGMVNITALGAIPNPMTPIPIAVNVTIPPGQTYAFALGTTGTTYYNGTGAGTTCPIVASDANLVIHQGFGGTIAGPIAGRDPIVKIDYSYSVGNPNLNYSWTPPPTLSNPAVMNPVASPTTSTTYTVVATDPLTTCSSSGTVSVTVLNSISTPVAASSVTNICGSSGTTDLSVTNATLGLTYQWQTSLTGSPGSWTNLATGSTYTATVTADSYFRVYATCGTSGDTSNTLHIGLANPNITSTNGVTRCGTGPFTISVSGNGSFDWYENSTGGTALAVNTSSYSSIVGTTTTFWVEAHIGTCIDPNGRQPVTVNVNPAPAVTLTTSSGTVCAGNQVNLSVTSSNDPNYTYSWSTQGGTTFAVGSSVAVNPASTTTYVVSATDNTSGQYAGCGAQALTSILVNPVPAAAIVSPSSPTICTQGGSATLTVTNPQANTDYTWNPGGLTGQSVTVSPSVTTTYLVTATNLNLTGNNIGLQATVTSNGGGVSTAGYGPELLNDNNIGTCDVIGTFQWGWVNTNGIYTYNWPNMVSFSKIVFYKANRPFTTIASIEYSTNGGTTWTPFITNYVANNVTCANGAVYSLVDSVTFPAVTANALRFNNIAGSSNPNFREIQVWSSQIAGGCTAVSSVPVSVSPVPVPVITSNGPTTFCQGGSVTLNAGGGYSGYSWSDGTNVVGTSQTLTVSPSSTTSYTVTVNNGGVCNATATQTINISPLAPPTITSSGPTTMCQGNSVTLNAGSGYTSYSWSDGNSVISTSQTIVVSAAGNYTVTVTAGNGCSASSVRQIIVNPNPPIPVVTPAGPINLCSNGSNSPVVLTADTTGAGAGASIGWDDIDGTFSPSISVPYDAFDLILNGNTYQYQLTVTNSNNCFSLSPPVTVNVVTCGPQTVALNVKVLIEGYYSGAGMMDNFGSGGCLYVTGASGASPNDADTMRVVLVDPGTLNYVATFTGIMQTNGNIALTIPASYAGNSYYIRLVHRNALETWSAAPVLISSPATTYDFTTAANKAYGSNMVQSYDLMGWMIYSGDISDVNYQGLGLGYQDNLIEAQDYLDMENAVAIIKVGYNFEDVTGDGIVEAADYLIMENAVAAIRFTYRP
jgi:hypothetical protein